MRWKAPDKRASRQVISSSGRPGTPWFARHFAHISAAKSSTPKTIAAAAITDGLYSVPLMKCLNASPQMTTGTVPATIFQPSRASGVVPGRSALMSETRARNSRAMSARKYTKTAKRVPSWMAVVKASSGLG